MGPTKVVTPDGTAWTVRRCWLPRRRVRWRGTTPHRKSDGAHRPDTHGHLDYLDIFDLIEFFDGPFAAIGAVLAVIAVVVLAWLFLLPLLLALLDAVILIVLALVGIVGRVLLHRPWEIEVSGPDQILAWRVVGWRRSGQAIEQVTTRLRSGRSVPTDVRDLRLD